VTATEEWPARSIPTFGLTLARSKLVICEWRSPCRLIGVTLARFTILRNSTVSAIDDNGSPVGNAAPASADLVARFLDTPAGRVCGWRDDTAAKLGKLCVRWNRLNATLDDGGRRWLAWYVDEGLQPGELAAVFDRLSA